MKIDRLNDAVQQALDTDTGRAILNVLTLTELRALADLNHLETDAGRTTLVRNLLADRFGPQQ